jgi:hypothetical protein
MFPNIPGVEGVMDTDELTVLGFYINQKKHDTK